MTNIYRLLDPETSEVHYVGQTVGPIEKRLRSHILGAQREGDKKSLWIQALASKGATPIVQLIEECPDEQANEREYHWIMHHYGINPNLTNGNVGERKARRRPKNTRCAVKKTDLNIRLTPEQKEYITGLAKTYGKNTTEFILLSMQHIGETRPTFQVKPAGKPERKRAK
jgi:hypothetical protein